MSRRTEYKVPKKLRDKFETITSITDEFCREHLNEEYVELALEISPDCADAYVLLAELAAETIPDYLLGREEAADVPPEYMGLGDESEAEGYVYVGEINWNNTPGALEWLRKREELDRG